MNPDSRSIIHPRAGRYNLEALAGVNVAAARSRNPSTPREHMSILDERREELDQYEFMMGVPRGRLAVAMDVLTDALTMVGQHGVYCQSSRQPGKPAMDVQIVMKGITDAKELISSVMEELRKQKEAASE
jgi:hypothetical protein